MHGSGRARQLRRFSYRRAGGLVPVSLSGLVVVFKDYSATTEGVVQTAFVDKNEPQRAFLSTVLASLSKNAKSAGNVLAFRLLSSTTAVASGRVGNVVIAGEARLSFMPTVTAHGSELGVVSGYWAPSSSSAGARRARLDRGLLRAPSRDALPVRQGPVVRLHAPPRLDRR